MKNLLSCFLILFFLLPVLTAKPKIEGELKQWHRINFEFEGPQVSENDAYNPFLNYRLDVVFSNGDEKIYVPGYFAADGDASESGASVGNVWRVHFVPPFTGNWKYEVSFKKGISIAVADSANSGESVGDDGFSGVISVGENDKGKDDYRSKGRLVKNGKTHYMSYAETGEPFLKAGAGSPENFLAFKDFDDTYSMKTEHRDGEAFSFAVKTYETHVGDWKDGDPSWKDGKGKGIIGAINYLHGMGCNSVYFLTMNIYGDGQDVWPYINTHERTRFDCSKLDQWSIVLDHIEQFGMLAHVITQETENELLLDLGKVGVERKLYYRELVARFSHLLAIQWNLGEENGYAHWSPNAQNDAMRKDMASYFKYIDPYKNPVVLHTHAHFGDRDPILNALLGYNDLDGPSFQIDRPEYVHDVTVHWRAASRAWEKHWMLALDEIGPADTGAMPDADDPDHDKIRQQVLWGNLMAGGHGVEWYFGYKYAENDLQCQDWRSRELLWEQSVRAVEFFKKYLPFDQMEPLDTVTACENDYVFALEDEVYCIYLPELKNGTIDLSHTSGSYSVKWFPAKAGKTLDLQKGTVSKVKGGSIVDFGEPKNKTPGDWVVLLKKQ